MDKIYNLEHVSSMGRHILGFYNIKSEDLEDGSTNIIINNDDGQADLIYEEIIDMIKRSG